MYKKYVLILLIVLLTALTPLFIQKDKKVEETFVSMPVLTKVVASQNGTLVNFNVKKGQEVTKGQQIAELEVKKNLPQKKQNVLPLNEDNLKSAKKELESAEENSSNFAMMYKDGIISQEEYDRSVVQLNKAKENFEQLSEKPKEKPATPQKTTEIVKIYATTDGILVKFYVKRGDFVSAQKSVALIKSN